MELRIFLCVAGGLVFRPIWGLGVQLPIHSQLGTMEIMSPRRLNVPASVVDGGVVVVSGNPETFLLTLSLVVFRPMSGLSIDLGCHRRHSKITFCYSWLLSLPLGADVWLSRGPGVPEVWFGTRRVFPSLVPSFGGMPAPLPRGGAVQSEALTSLQLKKSQGLAFGRAILKQQDVLARSAASCSGARASLQPGKLIFTAGRSA